MNANDMEQDMYSRVKLNNFLSTITECKHKSTLYMLNSKASPKYTVCSQTKVPELTLGQFFCPFLIIHSQANFQAAIEDTVFTILEKIKSNMCPPDTSLLGALCSL